MDCTKGRQSWTVTKRQQTGWKIKTHTDQQANRDTGIPTDRQADTQTGTHAGKQTGSGRPAGEQTGR